MLALSDPISVFDAAFAQRALVAVLIVALLAAALGGSIVLRDLPFFTHAVGSGVYPVLVVALAIGVSLAIASVIGAVVFAAVLVLLTGTRGRAEPWSDKRDAYTGLAIVAALATGTMLVAALASGDSRLAVSPEALLFGSVLTVDATSLYVAGAVAAIAVLARYLLGERWLAAGFDPAVSRSLGGGDAVLLLCVALAAGATLPVTGALLAPALLVIPAATARLVARRAGALVPLTFLLAAATGVFGLYLSIELDLPAGAMIAAVAGGVFALTAVVAAALRSGAVRRAAPAVAVTAVFALVLAGCGSDAGSSAANEDASTSVVTTTPQVADIVREVAGDNVSVTSILGANDDPHEFEPKPSAIEALSEADVIFRSGGDLDSWLNPAIKASGADATPVDLSRFVTLLPAGDGHDGESFNAHWYLAPDNVVAAANRVRDELIKAQPATRESFRANASAYGKQAAASAKALSRCIGSVPGGEPAILTGHNDFAYLEDAFQIGNAGQLAETGESEPSVRDVQDAVESGRDGDAQAVAVSKGESSRLAEQVAETLDVPLLELYADSLAPKGTASTLLGAIEFNVGSIAGAAGGSADSCPVPG